MLSLRRWSLVAVVLVAGFSVPRGMRGQDDVKRVRVPDQSEVAKAEKIVKDIFGGEVAAAKTAEAKVRLAGDLLDQGDKCKAANLPASAYVCFRDARDLAARAGDATLALSAVERLAKHFEVDALEMKSAVLALVAENVQSKETATALVDMLLPLIADAVDADNYMLALQLGAVAETAAKKSKSVALVGSVQKRIDEVHVVQKSFSRLQPFIDALKKDPKNAKANLELGRYYGLLKGKWEKALPLLAMGSDEALKSQARLDLKAAKSSKDQVLVGDGWWDLAQKEKDPAQLNLQRRAGYWYEQALGDLRGLSRLKAAKRLVFVLARAAATPVNGAAPGPVGELRKFEGHTDEIRTVAFSHGDGRYAVSGGLDQTVRVWDLQGKDVVVLKGHTKQIWCVTFHPNNRQVFSASWDATARLWDIKAGSEVKRYNHEKDVNSVVPTPDGTLLLTGCDNTNIHLWKVAGDEVRRYGGFSNYVYSVALSVNGRYVAGGSNDKSARVFDMATGNLVQKFEGHTDAVLNVAFSRDNRFLFTSGDGACHQYEIATGKEVRKYEGKGGRVLCLAVSSDGRRLLTGGEDKLMHLWDINTGKLLQSFAGHSDTINSVAFSPDNHRALSGGLDRTIRLWGLPR